MADTPWLQTDHDILVDLRPRVASLERDRDRVDQRLEGHDTAIHALVTTIQQVEDRLRTEVHVAIDPIEEHLMRQDETLSIVRERVASGDARWPQSAIAFVAAAATIAVGVAAAVLAHVRF